MNLTSLLDLLRPPPSSRGGIIRTFALPPSSLDRLSFEMLVRILQLDKSLEESFWSDPKAKPRLSHRPSSAKSRFSQRFSPNKLATLYIEHRVVPTTGDVHPRPYSRWSHLTPWPVADGSLQAFLVNDFFQRRLHDADWIVLSVKERGEAAPGEHESFSPAGLNRLGKGLSRLSWGLGNLFGASEWAPLSDGSRMRQQYLQLRLEDDVQETEALLAPNSVQPSSQTPESSSVITRFLRLLSPPQTSTKDRGLKGSEAAQPIQSEWSHHTPGASGEADARALSIDDIAKAVATSPNPPAQIRTVWSDTTRQSTRPTGLVSKALAKLQTRQESGTTAVQPALKRRWVRAKQILRESILRRPASTSSSSFNTREAEHMHTRLWLSPPRQASSSEEDPFASAPKERAATTENTTGPGPKTSLIGPARQFTEQLDATDRELRGYKVPKTNVSAQRDGVSGDQPSAPAADSSPEHAVKRLRFRRRRRGGPGTLERDVKEGPSSSPVELKSSNAQSGAPLSADSQRKRALLNSTLELDVSDGESLGRSRKTSRADNIDIPPRKSSSQDDAFFLRRAVRAEARLSEADAQQEAANLLSTSGSHASIESEHTKHSVMGTLTVTSHTNQVHEDGAPGDPTSPIRRGRRALRTPHEPDNAATVEVHTTLGWSKKLVGKRSNKKAQKAAKRDESKSNNLGLSSTPTAWRYGQTPAEHGTGSEDGSPLKRRQSDGVSVDSRIQQHTQQGAEVLARQTPQEAAQNYMRRAWS